jgi:tryptophan-rich sensory protein
MVIHARGSAMRGTAIALFAAQMVANLAWTPLFFGAHQIFWSLVTLGIMFTLTMATTIAFGRVRIGAAVLMIPYLAWILFAAYLTYMIGELNPGAETLVPSSSSTQIIS